MTTRYNRMRSWFGTAVVLAVVLMGLLSATASAQILFSPFKDVTINANYNNPYGEQQSAVTGTVEAVTSAMPADNSTLTWAFATGDCGSENWAGITPAEEAVNVQDFVNAGKYYIVSTGGANGTFDCPSDSGMETFIQNYYSSNMKGVDYDIEGGQGQAVIDDLINSTKYAEGQYPDMRFSFTVASLGASTTGSDLNSTGDLVMSEISRLGLGGNYFIDLMAFDFGSVSSGNCVVSGSNCDMAQSAIAAAESLHSNFGTPYSHIELCLMIGQADSGATATLSLSNVDTIVSWAQSVGLGGLHYWSFDRDQPSASSSATGDGTSNPALAYNNEFTSDIGGGGSTCEPTPIVPYITVNGGSSWSEESSATVSSTSDTTVDLGPQPTSGGSWVWTGPNGYTSTSRQINDIPLSVGSNVYTATYTHADSCKSTQAFNITVTSSSGTPTTIVPYISVNGGSSWAEETSATVSSTSTAVDIGPQPISGGSWAWTGPNGYTSTSRQINSIPLSSGSNVYTATYTNTNSCTSTQPFTITVTGGGSGSGSATLSPSSYNFGSTAPGTGTAWETFTLANSGSSAVSISNVGVSGPFVVSSSCGSSVAANSSCPIYVYFSPTAAGSFTGTLTVTDGATNSPQTASLSGTGS